MAPYLLAFIAPIALSPLRARNRVAYVFLVSAVWAVFAGIRGEIGGNDYFGYRDIYLGTSAGQDIVSRFEPLFVLLIRGARAAGFSYHGFLALVAILGILPGVYVIDRHSGDSPLGLFVYGIEFMLPGSFIFLRQGIAMGMGLLAIDASMDRDFLKAALFAAIATAFHYSGAVLFAFLFLSRPLPAAGRTAIFALAGAAAVALAVMILTGTHESIRSPIVRRLFDYIAVASPSRANPLNYLEVIGAGLVLVLYGAGVAPPFVSAFLFTMVFTMYGAFDAVFMRFGNYFEVALPVVFAKASANGSHARIARWLGPSWISIAVSGYYLAKIVRWLILNQNDVAVFLPYRTIFGG